MEAEFKHHLKIGLKSLDRLCFEATLDGKQNIVGSIYKEYYQFQENEVRTTKESKLLSLISRFYGQHSGKKNKADHKLNDQPYMVAPSGETANKFNEHLELILDFMGVLEHEPELWERIKSTENIETK